MSSLNGCLFASYVMSCLIIFLPFVCCSKKKYSWTYANSVNPDQTHMCRSLSFHAGTTFLDIFGLSFFPKRIDMNRF